MKLQKVSDGTTVEIALEGDFCAESVCETENFIKEHAVCGDGIKSLLLDFSKVKQLSNAGLMLLLSTKKNLEGRAAVSLVNVRQDIYDRLEASGITTLFDVRRFAEG